jgi:hypothetical protein
MASAEAGLLSIDELRRRLRAVEPDAVLVAAGRLRRLARRGREGAAGRGPARPRCLVVAAAELAGRVEVGGGEGSRAVLLLECPEPRELRERPAGAVLLDTWRLLLHARVVRELGEPGRLTPAGVRELARRVGPTGYDEALGVLRRERVLHAGADPVAEFVAFAAAYVELRHLAPDLLRAYFPALEGTERADAALAEVLDAEALVAASRIEGAPWPSAGPGSDDEEDEPPPPPEPGGPEPRSATLLAALLERADRREAEGNLVRAALLRTRAARRATPARAGQARASARRAVEALAGKLAASLGEPEPSGREWADALRPLLEGGSRGVWPVEARLLFDLQNVILDHERETYKIDVVEWGLSLGRRSIRRVLPNYREVAECRHLRRALARLGRARLADEDRRRLSARLHVAVARAEERLRERFRPLIARALGRAELAARNLPERVAFGKIVEELLDLLVRRGYLTSGDVRDAVSRNDLKLPDLSPKALLRGDRLLRADHRLGISLDGVYRRAEVYLRALQKASSVAFGTPFGRLLTLFLLLPFGGAFVVLEGLQHLVEPLIHLVGPPHAHLAPRVARPALAAATLGLADLPAFEAPFEHALEELRGEHIHLVGLGSVGMLGLLLLGLINHAGFRGLVLSGLRVLGRVLRLVLWVWPTRLASLPAVRAFLATPAVVALGRWLVHPLLLTAVILAPAMLVARPDPEEAAWAGALMFLAASLLLNSRPGERIKDAIVDGLEHGWGRLTGEFLPGLYRAIMEFFRRTLEVIDRLLYAVDEWLRFHSGEGRLTLAVKAVTGLAWSMIAYVVRFCVNLLIEPQVNPIKHFPVVTVAHKVTLPFMLALPPILVATFGLPEVTANTAAAVLQLLVPGVFGFLVWELKENWRLYEANRPRVLKPSVVGHHGETMVRLLRPGVHSGTIPRAFDRLRSAAREAASGGSSKGVHRARESIHHVEEAVRHFVEREFLALCDASPTLAGLGVGPAEVAVATFRILVEVRQGDSGAPPWVLGLEERLGWLVAGTVEPGWTADLGPGRRRALELAVSGFFKKAGVALVREQVREALDPPGCEYAIIPGGLRAWLLDHPDEPVEHRLGALGGAAAAIGPPHLDHGQIAFHRGEIGWAWWVQAWTRDEAGQPVPLPPTGPVLPRPASALASP